MESFLCRVCKINNLKNQICIYKKNSNKKQTRMTAALPIRPKEKHPATYAQIQSYRFLSFSPNT